MPEEEVKVDPETPAEESNEEPTEEVVGEEAE